jgi:SAM-dependent methyltransferase
VLDAGCGVGYGTALLVRAGATAATGVDLDPDAVADAAREHGGVADFVEGDLLALPFPNGAFDLVSCFEAIEHVADPHRALDELARVLAPGGLLLVSSPNRGLYPEGNPFHLHELTAQELEDALRARFAQVRLHRQDAHAASLVADAQAHTAPDPEVEIAASVRRLTPAMEGRETYTLAVAGQAELPALDNVAMLSGSLSQRALFDAMRAWQGRARRSEAESAALRREINLERTRNRNIMHLLKAVEERPGPAVTEALQRWRRRQERAGRPVKL